MSNHVPRSSSVCIHSVCVSKDHRHRRVGSQLLREYIARLERAVAKEQAPYERILLIAHDDLRNFYEGAGFEWMGRSSVVHGARPWYEMRKVLRSQSRRSSLQAADIPPAEVPRSPPPTFEAGLWEALQKSSRTRPTARSLASFPNGVGDVLEQTPLDIGSSTNKFDLLCPRDGCGSVILKKGVAAWVERASVKVRTRSFVKLIRADYSF